MKVNNTQEILQKIREANPELMELSFGCEVKLHTDNNLPYGNGAGFMYCKGVFLKETKDAYVIQYEDWLGSYPKEIGLVPRANRITEIIGHPVHLEHLLRAVEEKGVLRDTWTFEAIIEGYNLTKSVEQNLNENEALREFLSQVLA